MVLNTRNTSEKSPATRVAVMSPIATSIAAPPGLARRRSTMARDRSIPATFTPASCSGRATRPVPMANSSAGPPSARAARRRTIGPVAFGAAFAGSVS